MQDNPSHAPATDSSKQAIMGHIQAFVVWEQRPVTFKEVMAYLRNHAGIEIDNIDDLKQRCYEMLRHQSESQPLGFIVSEDSIEAAITPAYRKAINSYEEKALEGDLGKAGVETLALILYEKGATRRRIEYVRGVNCQFVLRMLMSRGYVNRTQREGERSPVYVATPEALAYFGIANAEQLPNYKAIAESLAQNQEMADVTATVPGSTVTESSA